MTRVVLRADDLHWIDRTKDNPSDQCVHGEVELKIDGVIFVTPSGGDWNLTAAGLFLLRTITDNNTLVESVCPDNFLIPCCGFNPWVVTNYTYPLLIQGCTRGVNVLVEHLPNGIKLTSADGTQHANVSNAEWRAAVLSFIVGLETWYAHSSPRSVPEDKHDADGWRALWKEWKSRSAVARNAI